MWNTQSGQLYGFELKSTCSSSIPFSDHAAEQDYLDTLNKLKEYKAQDQKNKRTVQLVKRMESIVKQKKRKLSEPSIKWHQIRNLQADSQKGLICGFLFQFRTSNITYFLPIQNFMKFWLLTDKKSINEKDIVGNGGIVIPFAQKRVRHTYDISYLVDKAEKGNIIKRSNSYVKN